MAAAQGEPPAIVGVRAGDQATLLDGGNLAVALRLFAVLRAAHGRGELDADALIPAARTVLVRGRDGRQPEALAARAQQWYAAHAVQAAGCDTHPPVEIAVQYDGPDLHEVAHLTGVSVDEVVQRHTAAQYTVAFTGFAPGFGYLSGGDPLLEVPRRGTPRTIVPAGSVGLAGEFSGVYPRESPGGWQLIGRTDQVLWDVLRPAPALLTAGAAVRFVAVRERLTVPVVGAARVQPATNTSGTPVLQVVQPGAQLLVQDAGRPGLTPVGVGRSGVSLPRAFRQANRLVGNAPGAAVLELGPGPCVLRGLGGAVFAMTGAMREGWILGAHGERPAPMTTPFRVGAGETLEVEAPVAGVRTIVAVRGGVAVDPVLGSRSYDSLSGIGPAPLGNGEVVRAGAPGRSVVGAPETPDTHLPAVGETVTLRLIWGPRADWFTPQARARLLADSWLVAAQQNRVGARLSGEPLERVAERRGQELPSEGVVHGAVQVPADGQPLIFLTDHPLTGGYPVIGVVHSDDLELAAQLPPHSRVKFVAIGEDCTDT